MRKPVIVSRSNTLQPHAHDSWPLCAVTRQFHDAYGLPPHRYQLAVRIMHAKAYLLQGVPIAQVASATGFADQSHLGRVFKAMLGITPGMLARRMARPSAAG